MPTVDDLARIAHLAGLEIARSDLERLAPILEALYAELERLRALPLADVEPVFTPGAPNLTGGTRGGKP